MAEEKDQEQDRPVKRTVIIDGGSGDREAVILDGGAP